MRFNERGECTQLTVGYVMDKQLGNTGGLGGVYGILYAIGYGLPFPEPSAAIRLDASGGRFRMRRSRRGWRRCGERRPSRCGTPARGE